VSYSPWQAARNRRQGRTAREIGPGATARCPVSDERHGRRNLSDECAARRNARPGSHPPRGAL